MRHGQTDWNREGLVQGRTDIALNDTGRQQAREAAAQFDELGDTWDVIVSSTLQRAVETAQIVATVLGVPYAGGREMLVEQNYGDAEGSLVSELPVKWPGRQFPGGEPDADVGRRGIRALDELIDEFPDQRVLAVSHGALIRRLISFAVDEAYERIPRIPNVSLSTMRRLTGAWEVVTVGGTPLEQALSRA